MTYRTDNERLNIMRQLLTLSIKEQLRSLHEQEDQLERALLWVEGTDEVADADEMSDLAFSTSRLIADLGIPGMEEDAKLVADLYYKYAKIDPETQEILQLTTDERRPFSNSTNIHEDSMWDLDFDDFLTEDAQVL